jgi:hypothetical protein
MSQAIVDNRWKVTDLDFARRITIPDLRSFFERLAGVSGLPKGRSLVIEPGTRSAIIEEGMVVGELYAGEYTLESFTERLKFWRNKQSTVFLTRSEEIPNQSRLENLPCAEGVCSDVDCRWTIQMSNVLLFMENLMGANEEVSLKDLQQWLAPTIHQAIRDTIGQMEYDNLRGGNALRNVADGIRSRVEVKLSRYGLAFVDVQSVDFAFKDGGLSQRETEQWISTRENQLQRAANEIENDKLRTSAEDMKKKTILRSSLRELVNEDNLNKIQSREDFEKALDHVDRSKLLRTEEREQLVTAYEERKEDRANLREHILATINIQREQEIEELRLAMDHVVRMKSLNQEIEQARLARTKEGEQWQSELEQEREAAEHRRQQQAEDSKARWARLRDAKRQKRDDSWESLLHAQRTESIKAELELGRANRQRQIAIVQAELERRLADEKLEIQKRQELWEMEAREKRSNSQLDRLQRVQEMNAHFAEKQQRVQLDMENLKADSASKRELDRIQAMSSVSTEVLIATTGQANAALLADLKKHEASQDAIKAQAAANPAAELNAERVRLYEQLNATERAKADAIAEAYKMAMQAQHSSVNQMIGGLAHAAASPQQLFSGNPRVEIQTGVHSQPSYHQGYAPPAPRPHEAPPPMAPPPIPVNVVWYAVINGQQSPGLQMTDMQQYVRSGYLNPSTLVWKSGMAAWTPAGQVPELSSLFAVTGGPPPIPGAPSFPPT